MTQVPTITVQLVHIQGPLKGQIQDFDQFPVHIGRHPSCQVRFDKNLTTISRRHARIERQGNRFRIIDASTNGTFINGKRIADVYLRDGDVITFAENGPKASFLTKLDAGQVPIPQATADSATRHAPPPPAGSPSRPTPSAEPELTVGPDREIPVVSTTAPLVIQFGPTLQSFDLLPITIGSAADCDVVMTDDVLAARHVQIFFNDNDYYVGDLTGRNLVTINGRPAGPQAVLAQGAELALTSRGPKFKFLGGGRLAEIPDAAADPPSPPHGETSSPARDTDPAESTRKAKSFFKGLFK